MNAPSRLDKYLWAIRVYKTRTEAAEACKGNKVKLNGTTAKASKTIKTGDILNIRKGAVQYTYKVIQAPSHRVGAALVSDYADNLTAQSEIDKLKAPTETFFVKREKGAGRPTKKDRRDIDELYAGMTFQDTEDIPEDIAYKFGITAEDEL